MKIALAQIDVKPGNLEKNLEKMHTMIADAKQNSSDIIVFSELCVSGYLLGDKFQEDAYVNDLMRVNEELKNASKDITIIYGNIHVDKNNVNKDGRSRKFNAAYIYSDGEAAKRVTTSPLPDGVQPKTLLPNYRFFDDERYFFSTKDLALDTGIELKEFYHPFEIKLKNGKQIKIGLEVCEDLWEDDYKKDKKSLSPTKYLVDNGSELIINISASPWTYKKNEARDRRVKSIAQKTDFKSFIYVNNVGAQNNGKNIVTFDGATTVYNSKGDPIKLANSNFKEELLYVEEKDLARKPVTRNSTSKIEQKYNAIITGVKHVKDMIGLAEDPKFILGLSGGIDSALSTAIMANAVGKDKILTINLPTKYNSNQTINAARKLAENLGVKHYVLPIEELVKTNTELLQQVNFGEDHKISSLAQENIQAKIRGTSILSNLAQIHNALLVNNGNKVETALGYATLYGDVNGAIAPLGDLTKEEVYEMARFINKEREIIPNEMILEAPYLFENKIAPSAELKDEQIDPIKIGYHCKLIEQALDYKAKSKEDIISWYIDGTFKENLELSDEIIMRWNLLDKQEFVNDLNWFYDTVHKNVFKRIQSPPIIVLSKTAFGYDRRESMIPVTNTQNYELLTKQLLGGKK